jgi:hypothetical protein
MGFGPAFGVLLPYKLGFMGHGLGIGLPVHW